MVWANKRSEKQSALLWSIKDAKETLGQGSEIFTQAAAKSEQTGMNESPGAEWYPIRQENLCCGTMGGCQDG